VERVLVICGAGASSTFLVHWMRREADARGLDLAIEAGSNDDLESRLGDVDAVLVGGHLEGQFETILAIASTAHVPVALLPPLRFDAAGAAIALEIASGLRQAPSHKATTVKPSISTTEGEHIG